METSTFFHALAALLIFLQFTTNMNSPCSAARPSPSETNTEFIKTSCGTTTYPRLCYDSLSTYATKIQTSPKLLANTSLFLTLETSRSSSALMKRLSKTPKLSPREAAALSDCLEVLTDSVDELQRSIGEMNSASGSNFELQMNDIQTWVSAALTDDNTCMDGFSETSMNGNAKIMVRSNVLKVAHMTSNSLALVNNYATAQSFSPNVVP